MNILIRPHTSGKAERIIATRYRTLEVLKAIAELYRDQESHIKFCTKVDGFFESDEKVVVSVTIEMGGRTFLDARDTVTIRVAGGKEHYRVEQVAELFGKEYKPKFVSKA